MNIDEEIKDFDDEWLEFMEKVKERYPHLDDIVVIGSGGNFPLDLNKLENRVLALGQNLPIPEYFKNLSPFEDMLQHYVPAPGEEIGHVSGNSRKKVVVSNSGFPYPVPQQSKKRK